VLLIGAMPTSSKEIPLAEWAEEHGIKLRTAQGWAKNKAIVAKKKKIAVQMTVSRLVTTYVVAENMEPPSLQA